MSPNGRLRAKLDNDHAIAAYAAGRMKKYQDRTLLGDRVTVGMTPYDLEKARVVFRLKDGRADRSGQQRRLYRR